MNTTDLQTDSAMLSGLPGWTHDPQRQAIRKRFQFENFAAAFGFMTQMALYSEQRNHHPEWFNVYDRVDVTLTTHDVHGISARDLDWARQADTVYAAYATQKPS